MRMTFSTPVTPTLDSDSSIEGRWAWTSGDAVEPRATGGGYRAARPRPSDFCASTPPVGWKAIALSPLATPVAARTKSRPQHQVRPGGGEVGANADTSGSTQKTGTCEYEARGAGGRRGADRGGRGVPRSHPGGSGARVPDVRPDRGLPR